jgi:hypothetical protein
MDHRSKITMPEETIQKLLIMMHDRVVPMPDQKRAKQSEEDNQFELNVRNEKCWSRRALPSPFTTVVMIAMPAASTPR